MEHGRQALALAARNFYGHPDERIGVTGITGTNGKTTTSYLIDSVLRAAGNTTALVGTIEYHLGDRVLPAVNTTPESLDLYKLLAELEGMGGTFATMEVSSHALALGRVYGMHFHTAVFTNLTRDHLDFHQTMENYFAAKQMLFTGAGAPPPPFAVINRDDPNTDAKMKTGAGIRKSCGTGWARTRRCGRGTSLRASTACDSRSRRRDTLPRAIAADRPDQRL